MNYPILTKILSRILLIEAALLAAPLVTAALYGESVLPFVWTILIVLAASFLLLIPGRRADDSLTRARALFPSRSAGSPWVCSARCRSCSPASCPTI